MVLLDVLYIDALLPQPPPPPPFIPINVHLLAHRIQVEVVIDVGIAVGRCCVWLAAN